MSAVFRARCSKPPFSPPLLFHTLRRVCRSFGRLTRLPRFALCHAAAASFTHNFITPETEDAHGSLLNLSAGGRIHLQVRKRLILSQVA